MMKALLRKLTVLCLILVISSATFAGDCCGSKSEGNGDGQKSCESKDKNDNGDKAGCEKSGSADTEKSTENAG